MSSCIAQVYKRLKYPKNLKNEYYEIAIIPKKKTYSIEVGWDELKVYKYC